MDNVIELLNYFPKHDAREVWSCIYCGYSDFWLYADGSVECAECKTMSSEMHCFADLNQ